MYFESRRTGKPPRKAVRKRFEEINKLLELCHLKIDYLMKRSVCAKLAEEDCTKEDLQHFLRRMAKSLAWQLRCSEETGEEFYVDASDPISEGTRLSFGTTRSTQFSQE